jgi:alkanesulfonate monooxygenase SsuD/methylene tetrahydromethanopterin reductase-like flavin-dependent oxidoreductase (luciferase family)
VELGPLVLCTPFRNPGLIAWMANTLDAISGGRFVLGLGSGWHQPEFDGFGFEFGRRVSVFADSLEVLVPLLREGRVDFDGRWATGHAELHPPQTRPGGPPLLLAGSKPRMMSLIAKHADRWNSVWYGLPTDEFREERANLVEACAAIDREPATIEISVGVQVKDRGTIDTNGPDELVGDARHVADAFARWNDEGVTEVMCRLDPPSPAAAEVVVEAARLFHAA